MVRNSGNIMQAGENFALKMRAKSVFSHPDELKRLA
jgi:hypothetical protein